MRAWCDLGEIFVAAFGDLLRFAHVGPFVGRLFELVALGRSGSYSTQWVNPFLELGCLHLLVLSGSQASGFLRATRPFRVRACGAGGGSPSGLWWSWGSGLCLLGLYGSATAWSPPLTRGLLMAGLQTSPRRLGTWTVFALALLLQCTFFPRHLAERGFYLSWAASLFLQIGARMWEGAFARQLFQSVACALVMAGMGIVVMSGGDRFAWNLACLVTANLALGFLFDRVLQPLVCVLMVGALVGCALKVLGGNMAWEALGRGLTVFLRPFLGAGAQSLLVALRGFRYIQDI